MSYARKRERQRERAAGVGGVGGKMQDNIKVCLQFEMLHEVVICNVAVLNRWIVRMVLLFCYNMHY